MRSSSPRTIASCCALALSAALGSACRPGPATPSADAVASFRGGEVRRAELERARPQAPPPAEAGPGAEAKDWRTEILQTIALRKVLAPEAAGEPRVKDSIRERHKAILGTALGHDLGWDNLAVTEEEIREQYRAHPEQYRDPEKIRFQHVFFRAEAAEMSSEERVLVRTRLENLRKEVLAGADFDAMAREYSQSADAQAGGWSSLKRGANVFDSFTDVAWGLKLNEVSGVIDTPNGFHIVKLKERIPALDRKYEDVKEFARRRALEAKKVALQRAFVEEHGKRYGLLKRYDHLEDPKVADDAALITVGSRTFTMRELVERLPQPGLEHLFNGFFPSIHRFLDRIALEELLALEAESRGIASRPEVAERLKLAAEEVAAEAALEERIKRRVAEVPEKELRDFYTQNQKRYETTRTWDLDVIMLRPEGKETPWQVLKRAEALVARLRAGEDFATLARTHSRHYSAREGGRLEGLSDAALAGRVQSTAKFRRMLQGLKDGELGDAMVAECYDTDHLAFVRTGAIIVRLVRLHDPEPRPFEKVRDLVAGNYQRQHHQRLEAETRKAILDSVAFRVHPERLPAL
jgi:parvulin-like peptidyl-prolyl isomerase